MIVYIDELHFYDGSIDITCPSYSKRIRTQNPDSTTVECQRCDTVYECNYMVELDEKNVEHDVLKVDWSIVKESLNSIFDDDVDKTWLTVTEDNEIKICDYEYRTNNYDVITIFDLVTEYDEKQDSQGRKFISYCELSEDVKIDNKKYNTEPYF